MTSRRSESECTHTLTEEAAAKLRALAEETTKKNKKKKTLIRSSSVKAIFGGKEEEGSNAKAKKSSKKERDKAESSRKTRKAKRSNSISSPYSKRRERNFAKSEDVEQGDEEEDEEEEACELTPYLNVNARGFRKEKMMFAIQVLEVKDLSEESIGKRFTLSWRRGVKKENSGKTSKSFCSVTGVIQLNKLINCMCSMKVSHDANQYQEKSMAFVLRKEGKNKLQVVGSAVIDLAKFASAQHKTHTTTVALSKSGGGPVVANLLLEIAALQAGGDTGDSRKKKPLKKRRSIIISNNEALDKLMEEEAKRAEETGQFTDTVFSDTSSMVALSEASGDEQEVPFTGFDMVISTGTGTRRSKRRSLILPLKKEDVVEDQDLKDVEVEVKKQRMKLIPLEVVGIPTEEDAVEAEEQRRKRREAEAALRKAEAEERAKKEHELFVAMQRYEIQQMRAEAALIRYDTEQRQKLLDTVERLKGIIAKLTRERQEGEMAAQRAMEETKSKLQLVTSQLETVKDREKEKAKAVGDLELQLTRGVALTGTLEEEKGRAKKELEDFAAKAEVERKSLEEEAAALRQQLDDQQALHRDAQAKVTASLASAESRVTELEAELESGQRQQAALQEELARVKALLTTAEEGHKTVAKTLYATESDLSSTVAALKGAQAEVVALQSSTSDVGMELARAKATLAKREEEILSSGKIAASSKRQLEEKEEELSLKKKEIEALGAVQRESCAALDDAKARVSRLEAELAAALASVAAAVVRAEKAEDDARERKKENDDTARGLEQATKKTNEQEEALHELSLRAEAAEEEMKRAQGRLLELEQVMKQEQAERDAEREVVVAEKEELQRQVQRERGTMEGKVAELAAAYAAMEELKGQFAQMSEQQTAQYGELQKQRGILEESLSSVKVEAGDWKRQYEAQVEAVAAVTARVAALTVEKEQAAKELAETKEEVEALAEKEKAATEALVKAKAEQEEQQQIYQAEIAEQHRLRGSLNVSIAQLKVSIEDVQSQREMAEIAQRELQEEQKATIEEKDELQLALEAATKRVKDMTDELRVKTADSEKVPVLEKEVEELKDQAQSLGTTVERLKGVVIEKEEKIEELESTLVVVRTELDETHKQRDEHSRALEEEQRQRALDIEERKGVHETEVEQLRRELDSKLARLEQLTLRLDQAEATRTSNEKGREEERTQSAERLSVAVAKAESSEQETRDLKEKVIEMTAQLSAVQEKLDDATRSLAAVKAAREDSSKALIEEQERRSAELEEKQRQHEAEVETLHASLEEKKQELHDVKKTLEELQGSLANARDISSAAREESATILLATKSEAEEARREATTLSEKLSKAGKERTDLEEQLAAAQKSLIDATEAKEESGRELKAEQEARALELEQKMSEHSEVVTELKRSIAEIEETLAEERENSRAGKEESDAALFAAKTEVDETKKEAADLVDKLSNASCEIVVLEKNLSAAQEALAAASVKQEETARALKDGQESSSIQFEQHMREHSQIVEEMKRTIAELEVSLANERVTSIAAREESATVLLATRSEAEEARKEVAALAERLSQADKERMALEEQLAAAQQSLIETKEAQEESERALKAEQQARDLELKQKVSEHADRVEELKAELRVSEETLQEQLAELQARLDSAMEKATAREEELRSSTEHVASLQTQLETEREGLAMGEKERSEAHAIQISDLTSQHNERVRDLELALRTAEETLERVEKERDEAEKKRSALSLQLQEATVCIAQSSENREKEEKELVTRLTNIKERVEDQLPSPRPSEERTPSTRMTHSGEDGEEQVKFYFGDLLTELEVDACDLVAFTDTLKEEAESKAEEARAKNLLVAQFEAEKAELEEKVRRLQAAKERAEEETARERAAAQTEKDRERAEAEEQRKVSEEERERNALYAKRMEELRASLSMTEFHLDGMEQTNALLSEEALLQQLDNVAMHVIVENIYSAPVGETVTQRKSTAAHDAADVVFRSLTAVPSLPWAKRQLRRIHSAINSCALLSKRNLSALIYWLSFSCSFLDMLQALEVPDLGFTGKVFESGVVAADHISGNEEEREWQALVHDIYALVMELLYDQLNLKARAGIIREPIVPPPRGRFAVARPVTRSDVLDLFRELLTAIHGVRLFMAVARQVVVPAYYAANALVFHELLGKPELCNGEIGLQIKASLSYLLSVSAEYPDSDYQHIIEEAEGHFEYATSAANFLITISNEIAFPTVKAVQDTFPRFNLAQIKHFIDMYSNSGYAVEIPDRVQMDIEDACAAAKALGEMPLYLRPQLGLRDLEQCATDSSKLDWAAN